VSAVRTVPLPRALARALSAEALKLRGTLALWMSIVAPALVALVVVLQMLVGETRGEPLPPAEAWQRFAQGVLALWAFLMLPLFVTLEAALLAALEHGTQQWRHLLALPLPRGVHYLGKWLALAALLLLAQAAITLLIPLGGWVLMTFKPGMGLGGPPPWEFMLRSGALMLAASALIVALHTWIALRWRSFAVACGVGMGATVMGFLIGQSAKFGPWYPWSLPVQAMASDPSRLPTEIAYSALAALLVTAIGLWEFGRSEDA
jgi:hypothetical protein